MSDHFTSEPDPGDGSGKLAENIAYFARALRAAGLPVGPAAVMDAIDAVEAAQIGERDDFYWTLHAVFVKKHEHTIVFDQAFRLFWRRRALIEKLIAQMSPMAPGKGQDEDKPRAAASRVAEALKPPGKEPEIEEQEEIFSARLTVSDREVLRSKDFAQMSAAEIARTKRLISQLRLPAEELVTRRFRPDPRGARIDMRRTLQRSLRSGGHAIDLAFASRAIRQPPVVALVDISGSMSEYSRLFLHFLHAVAETRRKVHSFVFATRLTNISRELTSRDPDEALGGPGSGYRIGRAARASPPPCAISTGSGRAGCSGRGPSSCSSPTVWSATSRPISPSRWTGLSAPAAASSGSTRSCATRPSRPALPASAPCCRMCTNSARSITCARWKRCATRSPPRARARPIRPVGCVQWRHKGVIMIANEDDILREAEAWARDGRGVALATVVETWGSAPRPVGSHLVIDAEGSFLGSVSGGCVEGAVIADAIDVIESGEPKMLEFGVADETAWQVGLSCGGRIRVYVERIDG